MARFSTFSQKGAAEALVKREEEAYRALIRDAARMVLDKGCRFVFLAGPSCSGKTTTALRLEQELRAAGKNVLSFSTDDFFFDQEYAPKNKDGTPNYDAFEHTDSKEIIKSLSCLSRGEVTYLPKFDFVRGKRVNTAKRVFPGEYQIFLLEGIHALNDQILRHAPEPYLCFYLDVTKGVESPENREVLTPVEIRFCRRLIRDFKHRNASADLTGRLWENVLAAEEELLRPFQKNAAMMISTNFTYEIPVEKEELVSILSGVTEDSLLFWEAKRLLSVLHTFPSLPAALVPEDSVLREFID